MAEMDYFAMMAEEADMDMDIDDAALEAAAEAEMEHNIPDTVQQRAAERTRGDAELPPAPAGTAREIHFSQTSVATAPRDGMYVQGANGVVKFIAIAPPDDDEEEEAHGSAGAWGGGEFQPGRLLCGTTIKELSEKHQESARVRRADAEERAAAAADAAAKGPAATQLLVDKYRPQRYLDLTSAEDVNFTVLEWFKEWDKTVFPDKNKKNASDGGGAAALGSSGGGKKKMKSEERDTRPEKKILLVSGPPGAGKTTLANVIATHCGYQPVNINASMDRTANALDERIAAAATGAATLDLKPNCLILDEVDGVAHSSGPGVLNKLIKLSAADWKNKGKKPLQLRPVVCICNNPWEKELRGLREVAEHLRIETVAQKKLSGRLGEICHAENISAEASFLSELCSISNGDIRSCLFSLQFLSQRYHAKKLTTKEIAGVGVKDRIHSFADVMEAVFHADDKKAAQALSRLDTSNNAQYSGKRSVALLRYISGGHPEMERLYEACFEEYPQARYHDYNMQKTVGLLRTLTTLDQFLATAREKAAFGVEYLYAPQALVAYHMTCQTPRVARKRWQYSKAFAEQRRKATRSKELVDSVLGVRRSHVSSRTMILDYLCPLLAVLAPMSLHSRRNTFARDTEDELKELKRVAQLYLAQGLTFTEQEIWDQNPAGGGGPGGSYGGFNGPTRKLLMYPDLDSLAFYGKTHRPFPPLKEDVRRTLQMAIKNASILAASVLPSTPPPTRDNVAGAPGAEAQGKLDAVAAAGAKGTTSTDAAAAGQKRKADEAGVKVPNAQPPSALAGIAKTLSGGGGALAAAGKRRKTTRDMFGNVRMQKVATVEKKSGLANHEMFDTSKGCKYEQNQGFTNAVRKRCPINHWL